MPVYKRVFEINLHAREALFAEATDTIRIRKSRMNRPKEFVVESDLYSISEGKRIQSIVDRYAIDK